MSSGDLLMQEWEEFKRFEEFQARNPKPEPEPVPVDPFKAYTQGAHGQTIVDNSIHGRSYTLEQLEIHSTAPDKRFNDDPVEFYFRMCNQEKRVALPFNEISG